MAAILNKIFFIKNLSVTKCMKGRHFVSLAKKNPTASSIISTNKSNVIRKMHVMENILQPRELTTVKQCTIRTKRLRRSSSHPNCSARSIYQIPRTKSASDIHVNNLPYHLFRNYTNQKHRPASYVFYSSASADGLCDAPPVISATQPCNCPWPGGCPPPGFTQTGNPCCGFPCPPCGPCPGQIPCNPCPVCGACTPMSPCGGSPSPPCGVCTPMPQCGVCPPMPPGGPGQMSPPWGPAQCCPQSNMGPCNMGPCNMGPGFPPQQQGMPFPCSFPPNQQQMAPDGHPLSIEVPKK